MLVTPGIVLTDTEDVTADKLNLLGTPQVDLEDADKAALLASIETSLGNGVAGKNYFWNPAFDLWTRGTGPVSCPVDTQTVRADQWWCRPISVVSLVPTYGRTADSVHQAFLYAAQITGNSGVGAVDFGQNVDARRSAPLANKLTVTVEFQNDTGAAVTPLLRLDTCNSTDNFTAQTNRYSVALGGAVNNGANGTFSVTIDTTAFAAQMRNGCSIYLRFPSGSLDSNAKFVNLYNWKLEIGDTASARYPEVVPTGAETADTAGTVGIERNYLFNGGFAENRFGPNATCPGAVQTYVAQGWWARPSGGSALSYTKSASSPNGLTKFCAKLIGDVSLSAVLVDFGQDITAGNGAMLQQSLVFSCYVRNNTGAQITPLLLIDNPASGANDWSTPVNYINQQLDDCPNGVWTRLVYAFNGAGIPNANLGVRIYLRFDNGTLAAGSSTIEIAQAKLEIGNLPTPFIPQPVFEVPGGVAAVSTNLVVSNSSTTQINFSADGLALSAPDGEFFYAQNLSVTGVNITASGVDGLDTGTEAVSTWYAIYAISDGVNVRGLLSTSTTTPLMPGGYRFRALLGYVRNDASGDFVNFFQFGREVWQTPQTLFTAKKPTTANTFEAVSIAAGGSSFLAAIVPPNARAALCTFAFTAGPADQIVSFAGTTTGMGQSWSQNQSGTSFFPSLAPGTAQNLFCPRQFSVPLVTPQEFYWASTSVATADKRIEVNGYRI